MKTSRVLSSTIAHPLNGFTRLASPKQAWCLAAVALTIALSSLSLATEPSDPPIKTVYLNFLRTGHTATALPDGSALVVGGEHNGLPLSLSETFDPRSHTFSFAAELLEARTEHTATLLPDGRLFVAGGRSGEGRLAQTELLDTLTQQFSAGAALNRSRAGHTATALVDGQVLLAGGDDDGTAELFNPRTGRSTLLRGSLTSRRAFHAAILLRDGKVLIAGGQTEGGFALDDAEIFDPVSQTFALTSNAMHSPRVQAHLRPLPDGKVQVIGGNADGTLEMFNPEGRYFTAPAHVLPRPEELAAVLHTDTRAALIYETNYAPGIHQDPRGTLESLLDRRGYSLTELPQSGLVLLAGGTNALTQLQPAAVLFPHSSATITTDKTDYATGDIVVMTGAGWSPGQTVTLHVYAEDLPGDLLVAANADRNGQFRHSRLIVSETTSVTYLVTASGAHPKQIAHTAFAYVADRSPSESSESTDVRAARSLRKATTFNPLFVTQANPVPATVDIDIDWNRNGTVEDEADDASEDKPVDFLSPNGALVLVNCDSDVGNSQRDMDDTKISKATDEDDDRDDMSPISLELERNLERDEELWMVIENVDRGDEAWGNVMDPLETGEDQTLVGGRKTEQRIDRLELTSGEILFPEGRAKRYERRFLIEGLRFAKEVIIRLEVRRGGVVVDSDEVRVLNTPWLANNNAEPLADPAKWKLTGNLINSESYQFEQDHGAERVSAGKVLEFVQDSAEWGFQVRRQVPAEKSRTMITALRLFTDAEDQHPQAMFLNKRVGVYGYLDNDEAYFTPGHAGDQGGNLEALPPSEQHPFGRLVYGDTMSATLRAFLDRQKAQVKGGAVVLEISKINLVHVDEMLAIVPKKSGGYVVAMPDWKLAKDLLEELKKKDIAHNVPVLNPDGIVPKKDKKGSRDILETYSEILEFLKHTGPGRMHDTLFHTTMDALQKTISDEGAVVVELPGMFFTMHDGKQRGFPRNIANSQPTVAGKLVIPKPPEQTKGPKKSIFLTAWETLLEQVDAEPENTTFAWSRGGEAHCASNAIREPITK